MTALACALRRKRCSGEPLRGRAGRALRLFLALSSAGAVASDALPELKIIDHVEHYVVTGHTPRSIRTQLENRSAGGEKSRHGSTRSTFEVISKLEEVDGLCRVQRQEIVVEITTELPLWEPKQKVTAALDDEWKKAVARLNRHEAGHRKNVMQAAAVLRENLMVLKPQAHCLSARADIDIALQNALIRLDRRQAYYDRLTKDGLRDLSEEGNPLQPADDDEKDMRLKNRVPNLSRVLPAE